MYYEEQVIEGYLCWRSDPNGAWTSFTAIQLTARYVALMEEKANGL